MKKIVLILMLSYPIFTMAQSAKNTQDRASKVVYSYMIMTYNEKAEVIKSPKKKREGVRTEEPKKTNYTFQARDPKLVNQMSKMSASFSGELGALNFLGKMGWELVGIKGNDYYFKSNRLR